MRYAAKGGTCVSLRPSNAPTRPAASTAAVRPAEPIGGAAVEALGSAAGGGAGAIDFGDEVANAADDLAVSLESTHASVETGVVVTLTASASADASVVLYEWDLDGDGAFEEVTEHSKFSRVFEEDGVAEIRVRVTDDRGQAAVSDAVEVTVMNRRPVAGFSIMGDPGSDVGLVELRDASDDLDGEVTHWAWEFGDGTSSEEPNPSHSYDDDGTYIVTLVVTDDDGAKSAAFNRTVDVRNSDPVAAFAPPADLIGTGESVSFVDESVDPSPSGSIVHVAWDFGDGSYQAGGPARAGVYSHTYAVAGTYVVTLYVIDDDGAMSSAQLVVLVT